MITKKDLKLEGYHEYTTNKFQKCIKDSCGKRYFINIEYYNFKIQNHIEKGFDIELQFQNTIFENKEICIDINLVSGLLTVIEVETLLEKIWLTLGLPYYEVFNK